MTDEVISGRALKGTMDGLNEDAGLFQRLEKNPPVWWKQLKSDPELSIQIRKDNSIDVYYRGGCIITGLKLISGQFSGEISSQYIPLKTNEYVAYNFSDELISLDKENVPPVTELNAEGLDLLKKRVALFNDTTSEKAIQFGFIEHDRDFIDAEFAYRFLPGERKTIRFDLVRFDRGLNELVIVEIKTKDDNRLDNGEIYDQLDSYRDFISRHHDRLLKYYKSILTIKQRLGLMHQDLKPEKLIRVHAKPLLVLGDCTKKWIADHAQDLDDRIRAVAAGCYYFGGRHYSCQLIPSSKGGRHIFE